MERKTGKMGSLAKSLSLAALALASLAGCDRKVDAPTQVQADQAAMEAAATGKAPAPNSAKPAPDSAWSPGTPTTVKGLVGSEKIPFLQDPRVVAELERQGLRVIAEKAGSREIASRKLSDYDFAFPSGEPAAMDIAARAGAKQTYNVFYTPMAVATWSALIPAMQQEGLVRLSPTQGYYSLDMSKLMALMDKGARWRDLRGSEAFPSSKSILVSSTDVRTSNSATMYLSIASYVANGGNVVGDDAQAKKAAAEVAPLFIRQGLQESSSAGPFEDYTAMGMGKAPMVMVYESQFLEYQSKRATPNPDMVLTYPSPTSFSKSVLVPLSPGGQKLGDLLTTDAVLRQVAVEYGYRTSEPESLRDFAKSKKLVAPQDLVDVVDPPSLRLIELMVKAIDAKMQ